MRNRRRQSGVTLTEVTMVVAAIVVLAGIAMPAARMFFRSFDDAAGAKAMISGALSTARSIALKNQRYAGVRFQYEYDSGAPLKSNQYMIFIIQDSAMMAYGFKAVEGMEPIKLSERIGVTDLTIAGNQRVDTDVEADDPVDVNDMTTFSIVFSPAGKLVIHDVRVRNRTGVFRPDNDNGIAAWDGIFNSIYNIAQASAGNRAGRFAQDDYPRPANPNNMAYGYGREASRNGFVVFEKQRLLQEYKKGTAWSGYLSKLASEVMYINPHTGRIVGNK